MNVAFINPFLEGLQAVYGRKLGVECRLGKAVLVKRENCYGVLAAVIKFSGEASGAIVVAFEREPALHTAELFLQQEVTEFGEDVFYAATEVISQVVKFARTQLSRDIAVNMPMVLCGKFDGLFPPKGPIMQVPLIIESGEIRLIVGYVT